MLESSVSIHVKKDSIILIKTLSMLNIETEFICLYIDTTFRNQEKMFLLTLEIENH